MVDLLCYKVGFRFNSRLHRLAPIAGGVVTQLVLRRWLFPFLQCFQGALGLVFMQLVVSTSDKIVLMIGH